MPNQEPSTKKIGGSAITCGGKKSYEFFAPKVFIRTFGCPYEALLQTDFTVFSRVV